MNVDRYIAPDLQKARQLVKDGKIVEAAGNPVW
jgi:hypothetical protein